MEGEGNVEGTVNIVNNSAELHKSMGDMMESVALVNKHLEKIEDDASRCEQWGQLFDRIDAISFIGFQILNALTLLYVYMASL